MRIRTAAFYFMLVTLLALPRTVAAQAGVDRHDDHRLETLRPGAFVVQTQTVPVDVVFIGYSSGQIDERALLASLPATYSPVVR